MSGSLDIHGFVDNWSAVQSYLFDIDPGDGDNPEDDWAWNEERLGVFDANAASSKFVTSPSSDSKSANNWTQNCVIATSPMADLFVICRKEKAVFMTSEWDARANKTKYYKLFEGNLSVEGESITNALCIPLISKKKSSPGAPDWTCVVIGFSDGYVRMYTENGSLLISQMFHNQAVTAIKCHSYQPAANAMGHDQLEELFIMYTTVLVTVDGFGLFQSLRACRNRMARYQANASGEAMVDPPPLAYKKWEYESEAVADCESVGVHTASTFDHLLAASIIGGVTAKHNKVPYTSTIFATTGEKPYLTFHYAQEGQAPMMIGEFAYHVASKLKSSLLNAASGWLGFGGGGKQATQQTKPEKPKIEPATLMAGRFGLPDKDRKGQSIVISPCHKLSAVTDSLGRVVLIDNERGIAVRMWKGYRDAQCAWLQVDDDMNSKTRKASGRKALFLVIYAPRRGQLEIFSMQQGPKVASFTTTKFGRILATSYGMMGLNNIPIKGGNAPSFQCLFLDHEGQLYNLNIPFHLALCDGSNSKLKDMHLLKSLQRMLRDTQYSMEDIINIVNDIKTQAMVNQAFKIIIQYCKEFDILTKVIERHLEQFCDDERRDLTVVFRIQSLLQLYSYLINLVELPPPYRDEGAENTLHDNTVLLCLHATEKEIKLVKDMANKELFNKASPAKSVKFQEDRNFLSVNELLALFTLEYDPAKIKLISSSNETKLTLNYKSDNLPKLGKLLFCGCFNSNTDLKEWKSLLKNCDLIPSDLLLEVLKFWCSNALVSSSFIDMMGRLYQVVRALCDIEGVTNTINEAGAWWDTIRKQIAHNCKIFYIYTFSMVCRAVAIDIHQEADKQDNLKGKEKLLDTTRESNTESEPQPVIDGEEPMETNDMESGDLDYEGWENVSLDLIRWNILLKQIEDLSFLSTILAQKPPLSNPALPILSVTISDLSVVSLLEKGSGCIAELVGRWLTTIGVDPSVIADASEVPVIENRISPEYTEKELRKKQKMEMVVDEQNMETNDENDLEAAAHANSEISYIIELLRCLKDNFTVSLNSSIILANYCWEYCLIWNQNVDLVHYLNAAINCVAVVPDHFIKQGLMSMMWSTFISKQLSNIVLRGKLAKEKLIEKVSGFSNQESKVMFLRACVKFLDEFMENNVICQGIQKPRTASSSTKKNHWTNDTSSSTASLTDLAMAQPIANYEMILLHYQLALTALFVYNFHIRKGSMRPINLFDTKAGMMFFAAVSSPAPYSNVEVDLALKVLREEFLCLVVTNAIDKVPEDLDSSLEDHSKSSKVTYISPSQTGVRDCEFWIHKCFELGRIWGLDLDSLRINQVCEFYSSGYDLLGLEAVGAVNGKDILGSKLLVVAGMRLHYYIQTNRDSSTTEMASSLSTNLSNWLNKLDYSKLRCLRFPKSSISDLAQQIVQLIPESSYDFKLADDLLLCSSFLN